MRPNHQIIDIPLALVVILTFHSTLPLSPSSLLGGDSRDSVLFPLLALPSPSAPDAESRELAELPLRESASRRRRTRRNLRFSRRAGRVLHNVAGLGHAVCMLKFEDFFESATCFGPFWYTRRCY